MFRPTLFLIGALLAPVAAHANEAANYPEKPIRIVVPYLPGGAADVITRRLAERLSQRVKQPIIIDNRPGGNTLIGTEAVVKAAPDGYTLFLAAASYTVNPSLYKLGFDPIKDITPIAQLARGPFVIAVNPGVKFASLKDLVEAARKEPNKLSYASAGNGSITHLATEYFIEVTKADMMHVPYKGTSPALTDTISGQTQVVFGTVASTLPFAKSGRLKALAVTTPRRLPALPDVPTVMESGFQYEVTNWHGLIGPKGIPPEIVARLNKAINESLTVKGMDESLAQDGLTAAGGSPEAFGALLKSELERWGSLVKSKKISLD